MIISCHHCHKPIGELSLKLYMDNYKGTLVEGRRKLFCNEHCYEMYLLRHLVEEYKGNRIYKVIKYGKIFYIPYVGCNYGFETIQDCKSRIDNKNIGIYF